MKTPEEWYQDLKMGAAPDYDIRDVHTAMLSAFEAYARARIAEERARWIECAKYDATLPKPLFRNWDRSALDRLRVQVEEEMKESK